MVFITIKIIILGEHIIANNGGNIFKIIGTFTINTQNVKEEISSKKEEKIRIFKVNAIRESM